MNEAEHLFLVAEEKSEEISEEFSIEKAENFRQIPIGIHNYKPIVEAILFSAAEPLDLQALALCYPGSVRPSHQELKNILQELTEDYQTRGIQLVKVANGYRFMIDPEIVAQLPTLWQKNVGRLSRALLETLAIIIYRQPVTRGDIEDIRGVAVSSQIIKNLLEYKWVKVVGHRDVPGKPVLFATTKQLLDALNVTALSELPSLPELRDIDKIENRLLKLTASVSDDETEENYESQATERNQKINKEPKINAAPATNAIL